MIKRYLTLQSSHKHVPWPNCRKTISPKIDTKWVAGKQGSYCMGPKEGEVWVTYNEMREMNRSGRVPK